MLEQVLAQQIADDITEVIGHNVLITDDAGVVLGSGDQSRVGQFHEASVEVVRTRRIIAHSGDVARGLIGSLPGVTVPVVVDGHIVGTVALAGSPRQVKKFGLVVKRQTEILLQEAARIGSRLTHENATTELVRDIVDWHNSGLDKRHLMQRARTLGHDLFLRRRFVLVQPERSEAAASEMTLDELIRQVRALMNRADDVVAPLTRTVVAALMPERESAEESAAVLHRCDGLISTMEDRAVRVRVAVGSVASGISELNRSARDALDAMHLGPLNHPGDSIHAIDQLRLPQALSSIPIDSRNRLADSLFGTLRDDRDWHLLRATLIAWGDCGFNVTKAAAHLHLHRNTFMNRLEKVARMLGRSLDEPGLTPALYVTSLIDNLGSSSSRPPKNG
jgi:carbohydrate diacid regulator